MKVRGLDKLAAVRARLLRMAGPEGAAIYTEAVRAAVEEQVFACFAGQRDPSGNPWAARVTPTGSWPLLDRTGEGVSSVRVESARGGVNSIRVLSLPYMKFHVTGTERMVARPFVPRRGLGPIWRPAIFRAAREAMKKVLRGG